MRRRELLLAAAGIACGLPVRAATLPPHVVLDRRTGVTVTLAQRAWVFTQEQAALSGFGRDFTALRALDVNRAGTHQAWLAVSCWSTVAGRAVFEGDPPRLSLTLDDRRVELGLQPAATALAAAGMGRWPLEEEGKGARLYLAAVDLPLIHQWAAAQAMSIRWSSHAERDGRPMQAWRPAPEALAGWLAAQP